MFRLSRAAGHVLPALLFLVLAVAWTFPLVTAITTSIPGEPGDNLDFLWNVWWMRQAVASSSIDFFHTDRLFAPFGADLTLHTHTALPAWIAATALASFPAITAQNVVIIGALALNGFAAYLLAWDVTRDRLASMVAGVVFGGSAYVAAHLLGHFNLIGAWGIPLFLLFIIRAIERRSRVAALAAGVCLALTAFVDYYYVVYASLIGLGLAVASARSSPGTNWGTRLAPPGLHADDGYLGSTYFIFGGEIPARARRVIGVLLVVDLLMALAVIVSGGFTATVAGVRITATRPTNLLAFGWLLFALWAYARWPRKFVWNPPTIAGLADRFALLWPTALVALAGMSPIVARGWRLWWAGDYTAPPASWRSGPPGVDLATLLLGHPRNALTGPWTRRVYERLGVDPIEGSAWIGGVALVIVVRAFMSARRDRIVSTDARRDYIVSRWLVIGSVFFVWALGPWLKVGGFETGLLLPQNLFSFLPILSNARMPGRAMSVVVLAAGVVAAVMLTRVSPRWRTAAVIGALVVSVLDGWIAPFPLTRVDIPSLYLALRDMPAGTVCELPVGLRDGFGSVGRLDERVASYQMTHAHPIVGGFLARVPDSIKRGYEELPVVRSLFRLSAADAIDPRDASLDRAAVGASLRQAGIRYLVLNRETAPGALAAYVVNSIPARLVLKDESRELYELDQ
jgi:hypothetical protein